MTKDSKIIGVVTEADIIGKVDREYHTYITDKNQGPQNGVDIKRMLAADILLVREQIADAGEIAVLGPRTAIWSFEHIPSAVRHYELDTITCP